MGKRFVYLLWCAAVIGLYLTSGVFAYSPFADAGRAGAARGYYGPTHK
jgi:hypothetical protein